MRLLLALLVMEGAAFAQDVPQVDPGGNGDVPTINPSSGNDGSGTSITNNAPTANPGGGPAMVQGTQAQPGQAQPGQNEAQGGGEDDGLYLGGNNATDQHTYQPQHLEGPVPDTHVVRRGDTLWGICGDYFGDPFRWPEIWSYNPQITNPHWIYPGDIVRLLPAGQAAPPPTTPTPENPNPAEPTPAPLPRGGIELRQLAFVSLEDLKIAGTVVGSTEEHDLLSTNDTIYVSYPDGKPPQVGQQYAIYTPTKDITEPGKGGRKVGAYVRLIGAVRIDSVKKDKMAQGTILYVTDAVERGMRVGTLKTQFKDVQPIPADSDLEATIVAKIGGDTLIGRGQIVFVDKGADDGLKVGNRLTVVRRGDQLPDQGGHETPAGQNDPKYPEFIIADAVVIETASKTAVLTVVGSDREAFEGDRVVMRKGR